MAEYAEKMTARAASGYRDGDVGEFGLVDTEAQPAPWMVWRHEDEALAKVLQALELNLGGLYRRLAPVLTSRAEGPGRQSDGDEKAMLSQGEVVDRITFYQDRIGRLVGLCEEIDARLVLPPDPDGEPRSTHLT